MSVASLPATCRGLNDGSKCNPHHPNPGKRCQHEGVVPVFYGPNEVAPQPMVHCGPPAFLPSELPHDREEVSKTAKAGVDMHNLPPQGTRQYFHELRVRTDAQLKSVAALASFPPDGTSHRSWLRAKAEEGKLDPMIPFPVPVVSSRDATVEPFPPVVLKLAGRAEAAGWSVYRQYAKGCTPHATTGRPGPVRPSFAFVMAHPDGRRACAVYMGQSKGFKWESMWVLEPGAPMRRCTTLAMFQALLMLGPRQDVPVPGLLA